MPFNLPPANIFPEYSNTSSLRDMWTVEGDANIKKETSFKPFLIRYLINSIQIITSSNVTAIAQYGVGYLLRQYPKLMNSGLDVWQINAIIVASQVVATGVTTLTFSGLIEMTSTCLEKTRHDIRNNGDGKTKLNRLAALNVIKSTMGQMSVYAVLDPVMQHLSTLHPALSTAGTAIATAIASLFILVLVDYIFIRWYIEKSNPEKQRIKQADIFDLSDEEAADRRSSLAITAKTEFGYYEDLKRLQQQIRSSYFIENLYQVFFISFAITIYYLYGVKYINNDDAWVQAVIFSVHTLIASIFAKLLSFTIRSIPIAYGQLASSINSLISYLNTTSEQKLLE